MTTSTVTPTPDLALLDQISDQALAYSPPPDAPDLALKLKRSFQNISSNDLNLAIELILARRIAVSRNLAPPSGRFYASRQSLQQSTHPMIAQHHAQRFAGCSHVVEICGGAGFDTAALARAAKHVTSYEADPILAEFLKANLAQMGINNVTVQATPWTADLHCDHYDGLWADPSRRNADGSRVSDPEEYHPALSELFKAKITGIRGLKLSPGLNLELDSNSDANWVREWIGFDGECREQIVWSAGQPQVTLVDRDISWRLDSTTSDTQSSIIQPVDVRTLVEPHSAMIRSGALAQFFVQHSIQLLDPHIAYGASPSQLPNSPWWSAFTVLESFPYTQAALKRKVSELRWNSRTEIKKRGFPKEPDEVRRELDLAPPAISSEFGVIVLTRIGRENYVFLAQRVS